MGIGRPKGVIDYIMQTQPQFEEQQQHGRIVAFAAENVMRLQAVEIQPGEDPMVVIGGKNGQGKSSVLNCIEMALGGADSISKKPIRKGEEKGRIVVDLGDIIVKRTFTKGGGTNLVVTNKDGVPFDKPQTLLDKLIGRLSFDPLSFAKAKAPEQSKTLRELCGLDFTAIDAGQKKVFDERTENNRKVERAQARLVTMPEHTGVTGEEQSTASILEEQEKASTQNAKNQRARIELVELKDKIANVQTAKREWDDEVQRLEGELEKAKRHVKDREALIQALYKQMTLDEAKLGELKDTDLSQFRTKLSELERNNAKIRENAAKAEARKTFKELQASSEAMTKQIDAFEREKRKKLDNAAYPVPGLGLDEDRNVTWEGLPFEQASTSQQLRVSVAIGLALNKKLPILLIRQGSDLDPESLAQVAKMAADAKAQVWLETSRTDAPASVIMEDGRATIPEIETQTMPGEA